MPITTEHSMSDPVALPCHHCGCKISSVKKYPISTPQCEKDGFQVVCSECGASGPRSEDELGAIIKWNRRPDVLFWSQVAAYLGSVHAANSIEYEAKSVSSHRRDRQISILTNAAGMLLDHQCSPRFQYSAVPAEEEVFRAGIRCRDSAAELVKAAAKGKKP